MVVVWGINILVEILVTILVEMLVKILVQTLVKILANRSRRYWPIDPDTCWVIISSQSTQMLVEILVNGSRCCDTFGQITCWSVQILGEILVNMLVNRSRYWLSYVVLLI